MKKILALLAFSLLMVSCKSKMDEAMKSADKNLILETANEYFAEKKWKNAIALYERLPNLVAGTDDAPNVVFNTAYANYYDKNYKLAGHQFKNFAITFTDDPRREEAAYMSALCYYEGSMDYNLDQTNTDLAINELQDFLNNYPNSERAKNINNLIDELTYKQEFKAFENARQYFKMGEFKASNVTFENFLDDFPSTKLRPQAIDYIMKSRYELAMNSIYDLKEERIDNAIAYSKFVEKELPETDYSKTASGLREKLLAEKERFAKIKIQVEEQKAKILAKQKAEEAKQAAKQQKAETENQKANIDSAKVATPEPAATINIQK